MDDEVRDFRMTLIGRKFLNLLSYHPLHCGLGVRWSYRSSVVDYADVVVLPFPLIVVEWRKKKQQRY